MLNVGSEGTDQGASERRCGALTPTGDGNGATVPVSLHKGDRLSRGSIEGELKGRQQFGKSLGLTDGRLDTEVAEHDGPIEKTDGELGGSGVHVQLGVCTSRMSGFPDERAAWSFSSQTLDHLGTGDLISLAD